MGIRRWAPSPWKRMGMRLRMQAGGDDPPPLTCGGLNEATRVYATVTQPPSLGQRTERSGVVMIHPNKK